MSDELSRSALRSFDAVRRLGSLAEAATSLGVPEPTISQQIGQLEQRLGSPVFQPARNGFALTTAGRHLADAVTQSLSNSDRQPGSLAPGRSPNQVEVVVDTTFSFYWLLPRLPDFLRQNPGIEVDVCSVISPPPADHHPGAVVVACGVLPPNAEPLTENEQVWAMASPRLARQISTADDLRQHTVLDVRHGAGWPAYLRALGLDLQPRRRHTSTTYVHLIELAKADQGVVLLHETIARQLPSNPLSGGRLLHPVADLVAPAFDQFYLTAPPLDSTNNATRTFIQWFRGEVAGLSPAA